MQRQRTSRGSWRAGVMLGLAVAGILAAGAAEACNRLIVRGIGRQDWQGGSGVGYEVFDPASLSQAVEFTVRKRGPTGCSYFVTISVGGNGTFNRELTGGSGVLSYNLYQTAGLTTVVKDLPTASASEVISGSFSGGGTQDNVHTIYFHIPPQQVVSARNYTDVLTFKAYQGNLSGYSAKGTRNVRFRAIVPEVVELSIVDAGAPFDAVDVLQSVNFGTLVQNDSRAFDLLVRSNTGYDMTLQSDNGNVLKQNVLATPNTVPYTLDVDGGKVDLSGGAAVRVARVNGTTGVNGDRLPATVTIGSIGAAVSGPYSDNISVVVTAR